MPSDTRFSGDRLSIRDAAKLCAVPAHTIRYWEKEFGDYLNPRRTTGRQRRYGDEDIQKIMHVKHLLWDEKFSVAGARRLLMKDSLRCLISPDCRDAGSPHELALHLAKIIQQYMVPSSSAA